jgi:hypothetical protein
MSLRSVIGAIGVLVVLGWPGLGSAQLELGVFAGVSNYQGDLASYSTADGIRIKLGPVVGGHAGYALSPSFALRAQLLYTRLSGDDALSDNPDSRQRNLDFFAPVGQCVIGMEWTPFRFYPDRPNRISPYIAGGGTLFYFNPKTVYEGMTVALQPLGTEGQYLDDYPEQQPYSRWQPGLVAAGGLRWPMDETVVLTLEGSLTYTFTDYLDDASTIYIAYPELLEKAGPLTAALANRQGEYLGTGPVITPTGSARANPDTRDFFGMVTLRASMFFDVGADRYKVRQHNNQKMRCPRF